MYQLKPLNYINSDNSIRVHSPTHTYTIRFDDKEEQYAISYYNKKSQSVDIRYEKTLTDAKHWIEKIHIPAKLMEWFDVTEKTS